MTVLVVFDVLLVAMLVWMAWMSLFSRHLFTAVMMLFVFGLMVSLAWLRLRAPDIALAQMAIGAGVTPALFLAALKRLEPHVGGGGKTAEDAEEVER